MFGYRLVREGDYQRLVDQIEVDAIAREQAHKDQLRLTQELGKALASNRANAMRAELVTIDVNLLRSEVAILRQHQTGLQQKTASIVHGPPNRGGPGSGDAMFDDLGDEAVRELEDAGIDVAGGELPIDQSPVDEPKES